ncbi:hypothetical protein MWU52_15795 [Jannaschia sp. S6380]|uniref:hypothetical protein n=1 Tax=Jannaschia sp. S6380 TaxID=2926408 RepID=UPI001FF0F1E5|nr:hypothetical protein [Jannaschia sp. S6380]MCK0169018.1 hypothetical protein [Jannaschia sp. S6380]
MIVPRVIRIEAVRFNYLDARYEGVAICRAANGVLTRRVCKVRGDPTWTHGQAVRALAGIAAH